MAQPEWLQANKQVYSKEHGVIHIAAIIDENLYFKKGNVNQILFNWKQEVNNGNLLPIHEAPPGKSILYQEIAAILDGMGKLQSCDIIPATVAKLSPIPDDIHPEVKEALIKLGINQLYSHQIEAWLAYKQGRDIILQTPTSSGKSISFLIPIIHECLNGKSALVFFNLKALAFDQVQKIQSFVSYLDEKIRPQVLNINGDIPPQERKSLYSNKPSIVCITPDVWNHELNNYQNNSNWGFIETIRNISIIVCDETHFYQGVFGAHFALLNRRTQLMMESAGNDISKLRYVFASATISNSSEIAQKISNRVENNNLTIIDQSGAKRSEITFLSLKPRNNTLYQTAQVAAMLVSKGIVGICFCDSRELVKVLTNTIRKTLAQMQLPHLEETISAFYGSMKPNQRNKIIEDIQDGKVKFIVSTSALEAGLDIGCIDATVVHSYPGSILAFRQRAGRAGRQEAGLLVFVPSKRSIMDSYYAYHPERLLSDSPEVINFNHNYETILSQHILACCKESKPTLAQIARHFGNSGDAIARQLIADNQLIFSYNQRLTTNRNLGYVHSAIKVRGNTDRNVSYINQNSGEEFEESAASSALREVYPGAIYPAQDYDGNPVWYKSNELNLTEGKAILKPIGSTNLFTRAQGNLDFKEIKLTGGAKIINLPQGAARFTPLSAKIKEEIWGYNLYRWLTKWTCSNNKCRHFNSKLPEHLQTCPACSTQLVEREVIELLEENKYKEALALNYNTFCIRVEINAEARKYFRTTIQNIRKDILNKQKYIPNEEKTLFESNEINICVHTLAHQLILSLPLVEHGANSRDMDFILFEKPDNPHLVGYFFDTCQHGTGMCDTLVKYLETAFMKARFLVQNCPCKYGCSSCTTIHRCPNDNEALFKSVGLTLLEDIITFQQKNAEVRIHPSESESISG
ncbi:DEAD/DEAH box helicase [Scytonema hofmannii PCC 7110]|uniref:DEAD/DEAH box helicase n=1 Tax=Scytonema hofmannii PCC 7110 TaxID=128403 RepID=A0A139WQG1_9CYAN|nr:DEAD/DEAH box helicase [Scytonema hofmannii]KYC34666.1 DEAD/DEAH box helicase [Scytonema hofmannii PCC 7110]